MRRVLAIVVFALAAAAAAAAGSGVVLASHVDPPGAPARHGHVLSAYRLPLFLDDLRSRVDPHDALIRPETLFDAAASAIVLATFATLWPRLARPRPVAVASVPATRLEDAQWRSPRALTPPRTGLHA